MRAAARNAGRVYEFAHVRVYNMRETKRKSNEGERKHGMSSHLNEIVRLKDFWKGRKIGSVYIEKVSYSAKGCTHKKALCCLKWISGREGGWECKRE